MEKEQHVAQLNNVILLKKDNIYKIYDIMKQPENYGDIIELHKCKLISEYTDLREAIATFFTGRDVTLEYYYKPFFEYLTEFEE